MPFCNKMLAVLAISALFSAPALADGTRGQHVNRGPAPVEAHQPVPPRPGCRLIDNGTRWACPKQTQTTTRSSSHNAHRTHYGHRTGDHAHPHQHTHDHGHSHDGAHQHSHNTTTASRTYTRRSAPSRTTRTYTRTAQPTVTRRSTSSTTRRVAAPTRTVRTSSDVTLDLASFSGGVGNGVDGGFYGGGGTVFIGGGQRFSGVLSHGASSFTFRRGHRGGGKRGHGGGGGCGCMGGGMGGGD